MARLVIKDNITSGGALVVGQTLRLGGFTMAAPSAVVPTMASRVIKHNLRVSSEFAEQMDPMELFSLNELLDRIATLGVATDYDRIGLKLNQRRLSPPPPVRTSSNAVVVGVKTGGSRVGGPELCV